MGPEAGCVQVPGVRSVVQVETLPEVQPGSPHAGKVSLASGLWFRKPTAGELLG